MTAAAAPAQTPILTSTHPQPSPSSQPRIPRIGEHVYYMHPTRPPVDALVSIIFGEHGMPRLTLILIRAGGGDTLVKREVPHRDHCLPERAYYILPEELPS